MQAAKTLSLTVRRRIQAPAARLFAAWTQPDQLMAWWGPATVRCTGAEVDLRVGGRYRIANRLPDATEIVITGVFAVVTPPHRLTYTWELEANARPPELVTVRFEPCGRATDVIVIHERIVDPATHASHDAGWQGCLDGLARFVEADAQPAQ